MRWMGNLGMPSVDGRGLEDLTLQEQSLSAFLELKSEQALPQTFNFTIV